MTSVSELGAWLADEHQISDAWGDHWRSLVDDVATAITDCGPRLSAVVFDRRSLTTPTVCCSPDESRRFLPTSPSARRYMF